MWAQQVYKEIPIIVIEKRLKKWLYIYFEFDQKFSSSSLKIIICIVFIEKPFNEAISKTKAKHRVQSPKSCPHFPTDWVIEVNKDVPEEVLYSTY